MKHGGNIKQAAERYDLHDIEMIDLSTGISPRAYPIDLSTLSTEDFIDLPQSEDEENLINVMRKSWPIPDSVKIALSPGSGLIISLLPRLCREYYYPQASGARNKVYCPEPVYSEHVNAWHQSGFDIKYYPADSVPVIEDDCAAVIAVQPGNPLGNIRPSEDWAQLLHDAARKGVMVVMDEAFIDLYPDASLVPHMGAAGQIVIRSLGKFYGLAGIRLGAVIGHHDDIEALNKMMGPWPVSSLAIRFGTSAIGDLNWADNQRQWLADQMAKMTSGFAARGVEIVGAANLYCLIKVADAAPLQAHLARAGFWTRIFDYEQSWMRLGLPADDAKITQFFAAFDTY